MDFKSLLQSMDRLNEDVKHVSTGNYSGRIHDPEDARDEYGHLVPNPNKQPKLKRGGQTKAAKDDEGQDIKHDASHLQSMLGGRPQGQIKGNRKHTPMADADKREKRMEKQLRGLRDWMEHIESDKTLNEATTTQEPIQIKPASQTSTQVIQQGNKTIGTVNNPQLAAQIKQSIGKGEMSLNPNEQGMAEDGATAVQPGPIVLVHKAYRENIAKAKAALERFHHSEGIGKQLKLYPPSGKYGPDYYEFHLDKKPHNTVDMVERTLKSEGVKAGVVDGREGVEESALQAWLGKKKYGPGFEKLQDAGRNGASEKTKQNIRAKYSKKEEPMSENIKLSHKEISRLVESINFQELITNADQDVENMLAELQQDVEEFKTTGRCSDLLDSFLKVHFHHTKVNEVSMMTDEGSIENHTERNALNIKPSKFVSVNPNPAPTSFKTDPVQAVTDRGINAANKGLDFFKGLGSKNTPVKTFESKDMKDIQLENWEKELNSLLVEGITVSSSKGQEGAPDSVSINATEADAEQLMAILRNSGMDAFGGNSQHSEPSVGGNSMMSQHSEPQGNGNSPEASPEVAGDDGDILSLIKKMAGGGDSGAPVGTAVVDFEPENGEEEMGDFTGAGGMGDMMKKMSDIESGEDSEETCDDCGHSPCDCDEHEHGSDNHKEQDGTEKSDDSEEDKEVDEGYEETDEGAGTMHFKKEQAQKAGKDHFKMGNKEFPVEEGNDGNLANNAKPYDKVTQGDVIAGRLGKDEEGGKEEVDESGFDPEQPNGGGAGAGDIHMEGHGKDCMECGYAMESCKCDHMEESYSNSNDDTAFQDLQYMLQVLAGGANGPKRSQAVGNPTRVTMETTLLKDSTNLLMDFQKLSGIK